MLNCHKKHKIKFLLQYFTLNELVYKEDALLALHVKSNKNFHMHCEGRGGPCIENCFPINLVFIMNICTVTCTVSLKE